jgi:hypothetical protein
VNSADDLILEAAHTLAQTEPETFLATENIALFREAARRGLQVLRLSAVTDLLQSEPAETTSFLEDQVREVNQANRRYLLTNLLASVIVGVLTNLAFMYFSRIVEAITRWGVFVLIPVLGVVLYWVRAHFRLTYGISEFLVGLITATRGILPKFQFNNLEVVGNASKVTLCP